MSDDIIKQLKKKYTDLGENHLHYLSGLFHSKPITYWDYVEVDTLLSLQKPRTDFKDETVFIIYHQVTELVLKLMIHEIKQIVFEENLNEPIFKDKLKRLIRYTEMLITSFDVMKDGMSYEDYNKFRLSLTPASGFQSAQFRFLEIYCTPLINLVHQKKQKLLPDTPNIDDFFEHIYWRAAGYNPEDGSKTLTLSLFEDKYLAQFKALATQIKGQTIAERFQKLNDPSEDLIDLMKTFDHTYNVKWPLVHLKTAQHYLDKKGENKQATGGSEWKKYLHPKHQGRQFFPKLWKDVSFLDFMPI
jgi:tryptophan 2,3-dioxygenase